jgi:peptide/nickel transport system ATP-binding protein
MLKVEHLTVTMRGTRLLDDVGFAIANGERVGLVGASGAGKSLLVSALLGVLPRGAVLTGDVTVDAGARIGAVAAGARDGLLPLVTVSAQIDDALQRSGATGEGAAKAEDLLRAAGLTAAIGSRFPETLSEAEARRVTLALALAGNPSLLIVDDAIAGLDAIGQRHLLDLVDRLCTERKLALLLISHDLRAVALLCSKVMVLDQGKIIEAGSKPELFGHPKHSVTRHILTAGRQRARTLMRTPIGGAMLEVRNVAVRRGTPPIEGISFSIRAGEALGVIGAAAAGQSTLVRVVAGLERASSGDLELEQMPYHGSDLARTVKHRIGFLFPDPRTAFNPRINVGESIAEPLQLEVQKSMDELSTRLVEVVRAVGISPEAMTRLPRDFTIGELQRLAIARALITHPRLLVLDDLFSVLDVAARGEVLALLNRLRADYGLSLLLASPDLSVIASATDRVLVMDRGRIIETATPAQLLEKPQQLVTRQLVAAQLPDVGIVPVF